MEAAFSLLVLSSSAQSGPMPSTEPPLEALSRFVSAFFASFDNSVSFYFFYRPQVGTCMHAWSVYLLPLSLRIKSILLLVYSGHFSASYVGSVQSNIRKNQLPNSSAKAQCKSDEIRAIAPGKSRLPKMFP